jgi:hypothetical protein
VPEPPLAEKAVCKRAANIFILNISRKRLLFIFESNTMGILRKLAEYLYIRKRDPNEPTNSWIGYMNTINRISIFMFLVGLLIIIFRMIFKRH